MGSSAPDDLFDAELFRRPQLRARPPLPPGFPTGPPSGMRRHVVTGLDRGVGERQGTAFSDRSLLMPRHPGHGREHPPPSWTRVHWGF